MLVTSIKVLVEDSGGCDCRVRGMFVCGAPKFELFNHVVLSDDASISKEDVNLKNGAVGIVICTPYDVLAGGEQRCLVVSSLFECRLNFYRSSWLKHKDYRGHQRL